MSKSDLGHGANGIASNGVSDNALRGQFAFKRVGFFLMESPSPAPSSALLKEEWQPIAKAPSRAIFDVFFQMSIEDALAALSRLEEIGRTDVLPPNLSTLIVHTTDALRKARFDLRGHPDSHFHFLAKLCAVIASTFDSFTEKHPQIRLFSAIAESTRQRSRAVLSDQLRNRY